MFNRASDDPIKLELMLKDRGIAVELARETARPVPLGVELPVGHQELHRDGVVLWMRQRRAAG